MNRTGVRTQQVLACKNLSFPLSIKSVYVVRLERSVDYPCELFIINFLRRCNRIHDRSRKFHSSYKELSDSQSDLPTHLRLSCLFRTSLPHVREPSTFIGGRGPPGIDSDSGPLFLLPLYTDNSRRPWT